jgi:hypothetical protein
MFNGTMVVRVWVMFDGRIQVSKISLLDSMETNTSATNARTVRIPSMTTMLKSLMVLTRSR